MIVWTVMIEIEQKDGGKMLKIELHAVKKQYTQKEIFVKFTN